MRFETTPGFQAQVDWKENFKIINKDGKIFEINRLASTYRTIVINKKFTKIEELDDIVNKLMIEINNIIPRN